MKNLSEQKKTLESFFLEFADARNERDFDRMDDVIAALRDINERAAKELKRQRDYVYSNDISSEAVNG